MGTFGENLKLALREMGWNQRKLADALGTSPARVSSWCRDVYKPNPEAELQILETLRISRSVLYSENPNPSVENDTLNSSELLDWKSRALTAEHHLALLKSFVVYSYVYSMPPNQMAQEAISWFTQFAIEHFDGDIDKGVELIEDLLGEGSRNYGRLIEVFYQEMRNTQAPEEVSHLFGPMVTPHHRKFLKPGVDYKDEESTTSDAYLRRLYEAYKRERYRERVRPSEPEPKSAQDLIKEATEKLQQALELDPSSMTQLQDFPELFNSVTSEASSKSANTGSSKRKRKSKK